MEKVFDRPLIILTGPTASGKSRLSVALAKSVGGEIISADSMQVYRHMDIGTAKIREEEKGGIPHHLIDVLEPWEDFNAALFKSMAMEALSGIYSRGHIPIVAGGTGFYIQALLYDVDFTRTEEDTNYRLFLRKEEEDNGPGYLHRLLTDVDPEAAQEIHANNTKRLIRALEFHHCTGTKISDHNKRERAKQSPYRHAYFVLNEPRGLLYDRIDRRVEEMVEEGLVNEVKSLLDRGISREAVSMQGLGYKETAACLEGKITLEEAVYRIKRDTRHFAKRQLTWFRRERDVIWVNKDQFDYDEERILSFLLERWGDIREGMRDEQTTAEEDI